MGIPKRPGRQLVFSRASTTRRLAGKNGLDTWGTILACRPTINVAASLLRNAVFATVEQGGNLLSVMRLLGAFLATSIQQAAMTRADIPEGQRRDFFLYVDEFPNFTTGSFASVLPEARKFRLSLIVAHQYLAQINDETADAVWGNVGSIVAFQVGSDDAERIGLDRNIAKCWRSPH